MLMSSEILSRLWTLKIVNAGNTALVSLGKIQSKSLTTSLDIISLASDIGSNVSLSIDGELRTHAVEISGITHSTNNEAYDLLRDAATQNLGNVTTVKIELTHADMVINGVCLVANFSQETGVSDFVKFSASLVFTTEPTYVGLIFGSPDCPTSTITLQTASNEATFTAGTSGDRLGTYEDLAMDRNGIRVVSGGFGTDNPSSAMGSVFVYTRTADTWALEQEILIAGGTFQNFGRSVAINGDGDELVSARTSSGSEAVEFWGRSGTVWTISQTLTPSALVGANFGTSIVMDLNGLVCAIVSGSNANQDKLWIFTKSGGVWAETTVITPTIDASNGDPLEGFSLAISGDGKYIAIGAPLAETDVEVYYVDQGGSGNWGLQQTVTEGAAGISFGYGLSINCDGTVLAIGEPDDASEAGGSVHIFKRTASTWTLAGSAAGPSSAYAIGRSNSLSYDGKVLLTSDWSYDSQKGIAFIYQDQDNDNVWVEQQQIQPALAAADQFGLSVALSTIGGWCCISAGGFNSTEGKLYMYKVYT